MRLSDNSWWLIINFFLYLISLHSPSDGVGVAIGSTFDVAITTDGDRAQILTGIGYYYRNN